MTIIRLIGTWAGEPTEFDGKYVVAYDPSYHPAGQPYDGGLLEVTDDPRKAQAFASAREAIDYYRQPYGLRPDGKPNRPLTAWSVEISHKEIAHGGIS